MMVTECPSRRSICASAAPTRPQPTITTRIISCMVYPPGRQTASSYSCHTLLGAPTLLHAVAVVIGRSGQCPLIRLGKNDPLRACAPAVDAGTRPTRLLKRQAANRRLGLSFDLCLTLSIT